MNTNKFDQESLFREAADLGILSHEELIRRINLKKQQQYLLEQKCFSNTWKNASMAYVTYVPDDSKPRGRRQISSKTPEGLEQKIIAHYMMLQEKKKNSKPTLESLYPSFVNMKLLECTSNTVRRMDDIWKKYLKDDPFIHKPIDSFTKADIKLWKLQEVTTYELTKRTYYDIMGIVNQLFDYAVDQSIIDTNIARLFEVDKKLLTKVKKASSTQKVYLRSEQPVLENSAWNEYYETGSHAALGIPLGLQIGCRIGEIVALRWSDIEGNYLHIQRMEQKQTRLNPDGTWQTATFVVVDHTKSSAGDRRVFLSDKAKKVLAQIMDDQQASHIYSPDGYIFQKPDGTRMLKRALDNRLRKCCKRAGLPVKSFHSLRRTYISTLVQGKIGLETIRSMAGHEDLRTTLNHYTYDTSDSSEIEASLNACLC